MSFVFITGATSGIGLATAQLFAQKGKNLLLIGRREEKLSEIKASFEATYGITVRTFVLDVTDFEAIDVFYDQIKDMEIDVVVNNAGLALGKSSFEEASWRDLEQMIDVNIKGFTRIALGAIPFLKHTAGHLFHISSIAGIEAYEGGHVYCGTKSFVKQMSKALRIDLAGTGVRVTDIAPGAVNTEFSTVRFKGDAAKADSCYEGFVPLYAEDIARCIVFAYEMPPSVNLEYMLVMPTAQASATRISKQ